MTIVSKTNKFVTMVVSGSILGADGWFCDWSYSPHSCIYLPCTRLLWKARYTTRHLEECPLYVLRNVVILGHCHCYGYCELAHSSNGSFLGKLPNLNCIFKSDALSV